MDRQLFNLTIAPVTVTPLASIITEPPPADSLIITSSMVISHPQLAFPIFISFGGMRVHFEGRMTYRVSQPPSLQLDIAPALTDKFDFHSRTDDRHTGWMDHALARLQRSGDSHPFLIEGTGTPFRLTIVERNT